MRHATQVALVRKVHALIDSGVPEMADVVRQPVSAYLDPERLRAERRMFRSFPLIAAHVSELDRDGAFLTRHLERPVLLTRDGDTVRAFLNVCRHRGTRLAEGAGCKRRFVCPYHGWTYDNRGALHRAPHPEGFDDLTDLGLSELACTVAGGFVWVGGEDGGDWLAGIADDFDSYDFGGHTVYRREPRSLAMNWKLVFDIFLEAYHLKIAHRRSIYPMFFDNVGSFEQLGPHLRNLFPKRSIQTLRELPTDDWELRHHSNILYVLFPNTLVLVQPDHIGVLHVWPEAVDRTRLDTFTLVPEPATTDKAREYWDRNIAILHTAISEDIELGESIQAGLDSGANTHLTFGRYEHALGWFHAEVERRL